MTSDSMHHIIMSFITLPSSVTTFLYCCAHHLWDVTFFANPSSLYIVASTTSSRVFMTVREYPYEIIEDWQMTHPSSFNFSWSHLIVMTRCCIALLFIQQIKHDNAEYNKSFLNPFLFPNHPLNTLQHDYINDITSFFPLNQYQWCLCNAFSHVSKKDFMHILHRSD